MLGPGLTKNYIMGSVVPLSKIPHRGVSLHMFVELIKRGLFFVLPSLVTRKGSEDVLALSKHLDPFSYSRRLQLPFPFFFGGYSLSPYIIDHLEIGV